MFVNGNDWMMQRSKVQDKERVGTESEQGKYRPTNQSTTTHLHTHIYKKKQITWKVQQVNI